MRLVGRAVASIALCALLYATGAAAGQQENEPAFKRRGAYRITVSGTATLTLEAAKRATCAEAEENIENLLVSGSYRVKLRPKTVKLPRVTTGHGTFTPFGTIKGFSTIKAVQETYDEASCQNRTTPATKTCAASPTTRSGAYLRIGADSARRLLVSLRGEGPSGFPGFLYCHDSSRPIEYFGETLFSFDRLSRWQRRKGVLVLSYDKPVKAKSSFTQYTGRSEAKLRIAWRRVRR